ncbi:MAG: helix-turn-helix domain-containing protein [Amphiplicatus sp.]
MAQISTLQPRDEARGQRSKSKSDHVANLASIGHLRRLKAGETLFAEGDEASFCYQVASGFIKQYATLEDGRRQVSDFDSVGEFFGMSDSDQHLQTAEAVTDSAIRCYPKDALYRMINSSIELSRFFHDALVARLQKAREGMMILGRLNAAERVAHFLLRLSKDATSRDIHLPMSRQDIADYLGLTVETVCRVLAQLKAEGVIRLQSARQMTVCDRAKLASLAGGLRSSH